MRFETSFFNTALLRRNLSRFWPLWFGYTLLWLLIEPIYLLTDISRRFTFTYSQSRLTDAMFHVTSSGVNGGIVMAAVFGIFFAMAMFSYLTAPKATQGFHSLPIRREALFVTNYLSGLICMVSSLVLTFLLSGIVAAAYGCSIWRYVGLTFAATVLETLFFYSFGALCMAFTGQILAAPVFYGVLNIFAVGIEWLVHVFAGNFFYGGSSEFAAPRTKWLSPIYVMLEKIDVSFVYPQVYFADKGMYVSNYNAGATGISVEGVWLLAVYAVVGLLLAALAMWVYRGRKSENTATTVAIEWARPIFQYGVTLSSSLALGQLVYYLFFGRHMNNGAYSLAGVIACMLLSGFLGFYASEMLLKKSLRVFRSSRKGACIVAVSLALLGVVLSFDVTGFEKRIPAQEDISWASVAMSGSVNYTCISAESEEDIALLLQVHRTVIEDKQTQQERSSRDAVQHDYFDNEDAAYVWLRINYFLDDGSSISRRYELYINRDELADPDSTASALTRLYTCPNATRSRVLNYQGEERLGTAEPVFTGGFFRSYSAQLSDSSELTAEQAKEIFGAVLSDLNRGIVDKDALFQNNPEYGSCFVELYTVYDGSKSVIYSINNISREMTQTIKTLNNMGFEVSFETEK